MREYGNVLSGLDFDRNPDDENLDDINELKDREDALLKMIEDSEEESSSDDNCRKEDLPSHNNTGGIWVDGDNTSGVSWRTFPDGTRKMILSEQRAAEIDQMCSGIVTKLVNGARHRGTAGPYWDSWNGLSFDELYQEAWLKVLEGLSYDSKLPNKLLATAIRTRLIDIGRYQNVRKDQIPISPDSFATTDINSGRSNLSQLEWNKNAPLGTGFLDDALVSEIENLFEEGTEQRTYVRLCEQYDGVKYFGKRMEDVFNMDETRKNAIAQAMGYEHGYVAKFKGIENNVRWVVRCHLEKIRKI